MTSSYDDIAKARKEPPDAPEAPRRLDGVAAYLAAESTAMCKRKGEKDTEFVKRIVNAYLDAERLLERQKPRRTRGWSIYE